MGSFQMAAIATRFPTILIESQRLNKKYSTCRMMSGSAAVGTPGEGAGKGGGSGGSVRDAGGSMGKRQAAQEEQFFRQEQQRQIEEYKQKQKEAANTGNNKK